jgi:hypothetical protein
VSALNCLNYLLDINPRYTSSIIKWSGVTKIVKMTQNIEYIDCAEAAIKAIEKMSYENPYAMIENDAFAAILSLIDFFDLNLRKSALKACVNMTKAINNMDYIKKFIIPAVPSLTCLTKLIGNTEIEKGILDQAVLCFFNIVYCVKTYNLQANNQDFYTNMIQYGLLENLFEVFEKFIKSDKEEVNQTSNNNIGNSAKGGVNIYQETFKNILKLFETFCSLSPDITNLLLNMNILEIIYGVLAKELGSTNNIKSKLSSNSHSAYNELFTLLVSFFPNKKSKTVDKLLSANNKNFFMYFSEKILSLLVNNIVNIPSSNTMVQIMKLLEMYITYSPTEYILTYIDPVKLSNIAGKMLDSKDSSYILEVFSVVDVIMAKVPEYFYVSFIREGVVDNIRNLIDVDEAQLYFAPESVGSKDYIFASRSKYNADPDVAEEDFVDEMEMLKDDSDYRLKDFIAKKQELMDMFVKKFENKTMTGINETKAVDKGDGKAKHKETLAEQITGDYIPDLSLSSFTLKGASPKVELKEGTNINQANSTTQQEKPTGEPMNVDVASESLEESAGNNVINKIPTAKVKRVSYYNVVLKNIHTKAKELTEKYFKDENINELLVKTKSLINPKEILQALIGIRELLQNTDYVTVNDLTHFCDMLFSPDKVTFYEIEKSNVIHFLTKFFDENFVYNCDNTTETDYKTTTKLSNKFNPKIVENLKMFFTAMNNDIQKINEFIKILQYCISSMNCFKLFLYDTGGRSSSQIIFSALRTEVQKVKFKFIYSPSEAAMKKLIENENPIYKETYDHFLNKKFISLSFDQNDTFEQIRDNLFKLRSRVIPGHKESTSSRDEYYEEVINQLRNRKGSEEDIQLTEKLLQKLIERKKSYESSSNNQDELLSNQEVAVGNESSSVSEQEVSDFIKLLDINFYVDINGVRMNILKEWTVLDFIKEMKNYYKRNDFLTYSTDMLINFDIVYRSENPEDNLGIPTVKVDHVFEHLVHQNYHSIVESGKYEETLFTNYYNQNIVNNRSLYCIKRAAPFIYLISVLELAINNFKNLFSIKEVLDTPGLENLKVTSLLFKQVKDPYSISTASIPSWCKDLCQNFTYLSGFNSRYLLFKTSSFDIKRSMNNLYVYLKNFMGENIVDDKTLSGLKRYKFKVDREHLLRDTEVMMRDYGNYTVIYF